MKTFLLIDANSLIHRAYHALPPLTTPEGKPIGAIYGLSSMLLKIMKEEKPDYAAAAFDTPEATFREGLFKDYKAHRPKTDEELVGQLVEAHELFQKFNVPFFEKAGYEADDIIAALVKKFSSRKNLKIIILTGDLDTLQLVQRDKVVVKTPKKGVSETIIYDEARVKERYGLEPKKLTDYKGLVGDSSDNIPGVPGVGPKTATRVIQKYGSLEKLYRDLKSARNKFEEKILENREKALFSKKLTELQPDIPLEVALENLTPNWSGNGELVEYFSELGFQSLVKRSLSAEKKRDYHPPKKKEVVFITGADDPQVAAGALDSPKTKVAFNWKPILKELKERGLAPAPPLFDLKIAGWLIDPDQKEFTLKALSERFLLKDTGDEAGALAELYDFLEAKLDEYELKEIFEKVEMPLIEVIAAMEDWGVGINVSILKSLGEKIKSELEGLARKIYEEAGMVFNINSSHQVANVLFEKLGLKEPGTKTTTGRRSTSQEVLKGIKDEHPIVGLILDYRENFKIESTFVKPLIEATVNNRIHTAFLQTGTSTGRLSSEKPNLHNLPQESKWSKELRSAFVASPGSSFLGLDYSQIELRLLAHVSGDQKLQKAFREGVDAHKLTAAQVFNVPPDKATPAMRRLGKTLNFGVIYGMGPRAFSGVAGITFEKAKEFIEEYFNDFPGVKNWQDKVKSEAQTFGFVRNENGRRRWFSGRPDEIERAAVNMPVQSLGADILKLSMIETFRKLKEKGWLGQRVKPVLTIHDELLFEARDDILKSVSVFLKEIMESVYKISVPLKVEVKTGKNLGELNETQTNL
jgi:DNA polymerase-1